MKQKKLALHVLTRCGSHLILGSEVGLATDCTTGPGKYRLALKM